MLISFVPRNIATYKFGSFALMSACQLSFLDFIRIRTCFVEERRSLRDVCFTCRFDVISGMVPASHAKVLTNIRKTQERVKRKKQLQDDSKVEEEEEDMFVSKPKLER